MTLIDYYNPDASMCKQHVTVVAAQGGASLSYFTVNRFSPVVLNLGVGRLQRDTR